MTSDYEEDIDIITDDDVDDTRKSVVTEKTVTTTKTTTQQTAAKETVEPVNETVNQNSYTEVKRIDESDNFDETVVDDITDTPVIIPATMEAEDTTETAQQTKVSTVTYDEEIADTDASEQTDYEQQYIIASRNTKNTDKTNIKQSAKQEDEKVYKSNYRGPLDDFIETLDDPQKYEFVDLFIYKTSGDFNRIPDYVLGGDNTQFFTMIFVYLNKFRAILSPQLLAKIYKQLAKR
jgi:hypothetical protein